ncbi:hypothetical protein SCUP234_04474 [Seiridium cupressi]
MRHTGQESVVSSSRRRSSQTSDSNPSLRVVSNRPPSFHSTGTRTGAYRYALLKGGKFRGDTSDLPISPILSNSDSMHTTIFPDRNISYGHGRHIGISKVRPADFDTHTGHHGRSKVRSADLEPDDAKRSILAIGHHAVSKVRSVDLTAPENPIGASKVRPAHQYIDKESVLDDYPMTFPGQKLADAHTQKRIRRGRPPYESKVRVMSNGSGPPIVHSSHLPNETHSGHTWVDKVRGFYSGDLETTVSESDSRPIPHLYARVPTPSEPQGTVDASKAASYWRFLPGLGGKKEAEPTEEEIKGPTAEMPDSHGFSKQMNVREIMPIVPDAVSDLHNTTGALPYEQYEDEDPQSVVWTSQPKNDNSMPSTLPRSLTTQLLIDSGHRSFPGALDPKRTAQWLRELLRSRESTPTKLTQLPKKQHSRRQPHPDYSGGISSAAASRVTTFSDENAADAGVIEQAVQNLEQLLSEILEIANKVADHDHSHAGDGYIQPHLLESSYTESSRPSSAHESMLEDCSTEDEQPVRFLGTIEGSGHDSEAISQGAIRRRGLTISDTIRNNRPVLPARVSSLGHVKQTGRRKSVAHPESPPLAMPPPDKQLRRDCGSHFHLAYEEDDPCRIIQPRTKTVPNSREVREYIRVFHSPPITPRGSSRCLRDNASMQEPITLDEIRDAHTAGHGSPDVCSLDGGSDDIVDFSTPNQSTQRKQTSGRFNGTHNHSRITPTAVATGASHGPSKSKRPRSLRDISFRGRSHVSIRDAKFSLTKSHRRQPIARDWSPARKRFVAMVACFGTAMIGMILGIYAGIVPAVQYYIADANHIAILGNVGMYLRMALPSFFCWPLPLLHGRRQYVLMGLTLAMPLLFPQAITVSTHRSSKSSAWKWALLLPRGLMGISLGFANMNFHSTLTDLFGASLMSSNPHQEVVDEEDVRRHGGGLGVWLGIWT